MYLMFQKQFFPGLTLLTCTGNPWENLGRRAAQYRSPARHASLITRSEFTRHRWFRAKHLQRDFPEAHPPRLL